MIRKKKGARKGRATGRPASAPRTINPMNDYATCVEVVEINNVLPNAGYDGQFNIGSAEGFAGPQVDRFKRATILASQYKFYRATRVEYQYTPLFSTYQAGAGASVPYLYQVMNRNGEQQPTNVSGVATLSRQLLQRMGATPTKLTKQIVKSYKPNTLVGTASQHRLSNGGSLGKTEAFISWNFTPKYDEWISTEALKTSYPIMQGTGADSAIMSPPNYYGHWWYIQQDDPNELVPVCDVLVKIHFEFKDPRSLDDTRTEDMSAIAQLLPTAE